MKDPCYVARNLLGNIIVRKIDSEILTGKIVETEAYYGKKDPASRAYKGEKNYNKPMFGDPGKLFIYMVHSWWLLNIVAHKENEVGAVLIRSLEPLNGIQKMMEYRKTNKIFLLTSGPGRLTQALNVTKQFNGLDITRETSDLFVAEVEKRELEIVSSHRIGVTKDLPTKLRFYIKDNKFVSK